MNNQTPNKRPASGSGAAQNKQASRTNASTGARLANAARPAAGGTRPATGTARPATSARPTGAKPASTGARPAANGTKTPTSAGTRKPSQQPPRKKKGKLGKDGILAIIMLLLVVILAAIIIICCVKAIADTVGSGGTTAAGGTQGTSGSAQSTVLTDPVYTTPVVGAWNEGYITKNAANTAVKAPTALPFNSNLLLINNNTAYTFPAGEGHLVEMYGQDGHGVNHGSVYVINAGMVFNDGRQLPLKLDRSIVKNLTTMLADMKAACSSLSDFSQRRLLISSGYRTEEYQQERFDDEGYKGTIALPGYSEHHTGLTLDIKIQQKNASSGNYITEDFNLEEQTWINNNCAKYGFILRYAADKEDITGIPEETWHFRYVGAAHATYMVEHNLCLEEYLTFLKEKHTYGVNDPLTYAAEGNSYTIYYFPASVEKDNTDIYVPASGHYEISGNNIDGFIVTVTHESK